MKTVMILVGAFALLPAHTVLAEPTGSAADRYSYPEREAARRELEAAREHRRGVEAMERAKLGDAVVHFGNRNENEWGALEADNAAIEAEKRRADEEKRLRELRSAGRHDGGLSADRASGRDSPRGEASQGGPITIER